MSFYHFLLSVAIIISPVLLPASDYYIQTDIENKVLISDAENSSIDQSVQNFINTLKEGDQLFFKRGDFFPLALSVKDKQDIAMGAYGDLSKPLPVIDSRENLNLNFDDIQIVYLSDKSEVYNDPSWQEVASRFQSNYNNLTPQVQAEIAESVEDVKPFLDLIIRFKVPIKDHSYFDPEALRVWFDDKEIFRVMLFEELKCEDCEEKIKWYYEGTHNYLYLFSHDETFNLFDLHQKIKINNQSLDTVKIENSADISITDLDIRGGKFSLGIRGSEDIRVENCKIGNYAFSGIHLIDDKSIILKDNEINAKFPFLDYRFHSSRGVQEGIFIASHVQKCLVQTNIIEGWGHAGINLVTYHDQDDVSDNWFINNFINGGGMAYTRGIGVDGKQTHDNLFFANVIKNMTVRIQFNGINNIFKYNYIKDVQNSPVKLDQGYGVGQGIEMQAYGYNNSARGNSIEKNVFLNCDEAAISLLSYPGNSEKTGNIIKENRIINCGNNTYNAAYLHCAVKIEDLNEEKTIYNNSYISNKILTSKEEAFVFYNGSSMDVTLFNAQNGSYEDVIEDNIVSKY